MLEALYNSTGVPALAEGQIQSAAVVAARKLGYDAIKNRQRGTTCCDEVLVSLFFFEALCITSSQPLRQTIAGFADILEVSSYCSRTFWFRVRIGTGTVSSGCIVT